MKVYKGAEKQLHPFINSALDGGGQLQAATALFPGKNLSTHSTRGWIGPRSSMGVS
jgi:hypothetical protein